MPKFHRHSRHAVIRGHPGGILGTGRRPPGNGSGTTRSWAGPADLAQPIRLKSTCLPPLPPLRPQARGLELAKKYDQHSVITREGLVRAGDGKVFPSRGFGLNQDATDYYSEILDGPGKGTKYQFDFPDQAFHPATAVQTTPPGFAADAHPPTQPSVDSTIPRQADAPAGVVQWQADRKSTVFPNKRGSAHPYGIKSSQRCFSLARTQGCAVAAAETQWPSRNPTSTPRFGRSACMTPSIDSVLLRD